MTDNQRFDIAACLAERQTVRSPALLLAPMEDVTDIGFRRLCKRFGAAVVYSEFVSAEALVREVNATVRKLAIDPAERPVGIQIYGRDAVAVADAAQIVEEQAAPDFIDLNFGCPVKKVAGKGAGAGMLRNVPLLLDITRAVVRAVRTPVTVKTRLGWDAPTMLDAALAIPGADHRPFIVELAERLQDCGIEALAIHGRTRSQMYSGEADWTLIGSVKSNPRIRIPIIGNGDIRSIDDARKAVEKYGVDGVMIGRATFGQPWIFAPQTFSVNEKIDILEELLKINIAALGARRGILHTRRHLAATPVFKGIPDFRQTRIAMLRAENETALVEILERCRALISERTASGE